MNLRDERWLPFEGQGAISTWNLVLDPRDNNFDFTTITDVIMHVRYTARGGDDQAAAANVRGEAEARRPAHPSWSASATRSPTRYTRSSIQLQPPAIRYSTCRSPRTSSRTQTSVTGPRRLRTSRSTWCCRWPPRETQSRLASPARRTRSPWTRCPARPRPASRSTR